MAVSGNELATLDFANLIGGPLNAVVEAQAKSAITTANFIKQVGFKEDGSVITSNFSITKTNEDGRKQDFILSVPFLTLLPIPYIKIDEAVIEFNAKITSTTESSSQSSFEHETEGSVEGNYYWFVSAKVTSKTSYQSKSASSDKEERSFDMHVKVTASNTDMPTGTEKILSLLEDSMHEKPGKLQPLEFVIAAKPTEKNGKIYKLEAGDIKSLNENDKLFYYSDSDKKKEEDVPKITKVDLENETVEFEEATGVTELYKN